MLPDSVVVAKMVSSAKMISDTKSEAPRCVVIRDLLGFTLAPYRSVAGDMQIAIA